MPYYLSYSTCTERRKLYEERANYSKQTFKKTIIKDSSIYVTEDPYHSVTYDLIWIKDIKSISLFSDGIDSFVDYNNQKKIEKQDIIDKFTSFKTTSGEFVKRRLRRELDDLYKNRIFNTDDVSMSTILLGDENEE